MFQCKILRRFFFFLGWGHQLSYCNKYGHYEGHLRQEQQQTGHEHELWPSHKPGHINATKFRHKCDTNVTHTYWFQPEDGGDWRMCGHQGFQGARWGDEVEQTTFISSQVKTKSEPKLKGRNRKPRTEKPKCCNRTLLVADGETGAKWRGECGGGGGRWSWQDIGDRAGRTKRRRPKPQAHCP